MAEINYKRGEPTVTVHGIPQSQYSPPPQAGVAPVGGPVPAQGGFMGFFHTHPVMSIVMGVGVIVVLIFAWNYFQSGSSSSSGQNSGIDPATGLPYSQEAGAFTGGAQYDANAQQAASYQNQIIALLQQLTNQTTNPPPPTTPPVVTPPPTTPQPVQPQPPHPPYHPVVGQPIPLYSVRGGDTLSAIASKDGFANWQSLYNFNGNAAIIQATAKKHGVTSNYQNWIYPGEKIYV